MSSNNVKSNDRYFPHTSLKMYLYTYVNKLMQSAVLCTLALCSLSITPHIYLSLVNKTSFVSVLKVSLEHKMGDFLLSFLIVASLLLLRIVAFVYSSC